MSLLWSEVEELRQMIQHYDAGLLTDEQVKCKVSMYNQTAKRENMALKAHIEAIKNGKVILNRLHRMNFLNEYTAIPVAVEQIEEQKILCPGLDDKLISRHTCLDYSGEGKFEECQGCEIGLANKKLLLK